MTVQEAIKTLDRAFVFNHNVPRADIIEAALLGIEALKFCEKYKRMIQQPSETLLPGETKEEKE